MQRSLSFSPHTVVMASLLVFLFLALYMIGASLSSRGVSPAPTSLTLEQYDAVQDKVFWQKRLEKVGPDQMRRELTAKYTPVEDFRVQHTSVHLLGELLYEKFKLQGIAYCDDAFNYGCYHGFMGAAASEVPDIRDTLPVIDKVCAGLASMRQMSGCYHGVGHGIVAGLGYEDADLALALTACHTLSNQTKDPCAAGAFMEYNARLLLHAPDIFKGDPRPLGSDPYAPCSHLKKEFLASCYYAQPDWWKTVIRDFGKIGALCSAVPGAENKEACYRGTGKTVVWFSPRMTDRGIRICNLMPERDGKTECRSEAARTILGRTGDRVLAGEMCRGLEGNDREVCLGTSL